MTLRFPHLGLVCLGLALAAGCEKAPPPAPTDSASQEKFDQQLKKARQQEGGRQTGK